MKTSLATALNNPGQASNISLGSSYQVPATNGSLVLATPLKFCLNFRPPTIAVVYTLEKSKKSSKTGKPRKYIHEIRVDFEKCMDTMTGAGNLNSNKRELSDPTRKPTMSEVEKLCKQLCESEATYLNINIISKTQVLNLITKLYEKKYGCQPTDPKVESGSAPDAPKDPSLKDKMKLDDEDDGISDDYDDDFGTDLLEDNKKQEDEAVAKKAKAEDKKDVSKSADEEEDDWGMDEDWGDLDDFKDDKYKGKAGGAGANKPTTIMDELDELDDLPEIGSSFPQKNEDKFNQVMSSSKEGGGLLASIGLNKEDMKEDDSVGDDSQEEDDPHKKSDLFDTSKDRVGAQNKKALAEQSDEEDFDLGFNSGKKDKEKPLVSSGNKSEVDDLAAFEADLANGMSDDDNLEQSETKKAIDEQFALIYEKDPDLRKALEKSDVANFSVEEKYQIIEAYMQGGAAGIQIELEDDDDDEKALAEMSEEELAMVEAQFAKLYEADPELQSAIGSISSLDILQKYQILVQYQRAGEQSGIMGTSNDQYLSGDGEEIIEHEGKQYRRVQIEGQDGDHLMDEDANIYTLDFEKIGCAGESDEDDDI